jgi:hypothetical protein
MLGSLSAKNGILVLKFVEAEGCLTSYFLFFPKLVS